MIDFRTYALFVVAALVVVVAPGPDILYVLSRGVTGGRRMGSVSALGIVCGEVLHTVLAVFRLAALLHASTSAFLIVRFLGGGYLIYLGIRAIRERNGMDLEGAVLGSDWEAFRQGVLTNLFNPKAILFYVTFLPQFVSPARGHAQLQLVVLGLTFAVLDVTCLQALAYSTGRVRTWLVDKPRNARRVKFTMGTLLVGVGFRLAFAERN
jgi:threonine/homoserine/homoserine lactone efflux protein